MRPSQSPTKPPTVSVARRAIGYVRVSSVGGRNGPGYHTLDIQREAIERVCKLREYDVIDVYVEEDWSGADANRPEFREVMDRVLAGDADAVAVWKVSRFSRSWAQAATEVERLRDGGKALLSADENFDTSDPAGRLLMQLLFSLADWEREVLAAQFETIKDRVIERGSHLGRVPTGYIKVRDKPRGDGDVSIVQARKMLRSLGSEREPVHGSLVPDPVGAAVVRRAYEMRADGASLSAIREMMDEALPRPEGGLWMSTQVARLLTLRTYLGEVTQSGKKSSRRNLDAHEPIISGALFRDVALKAPAKVQRSPSGSFPLSGRVYCAACSYSMAGGQPTHKIKVWASSGERVGRGARTDRADDTVILSNKALRVYRCPGRRGVGDCPEPSSILADALEQVVRERATALEGLVGEVTASDRDEPAIDELTEQIDRLADRLERLAVSDDLTDLDQWERVMRATQDERTTLMRERERHIAAQRRGGIDRTTWEQLTQDERLEVLRDSVHAIFVRRLPGRSSPGDRIHVVWSGDPDTPPLGGRANRIAPFRFVFPKRN